MTIHGRRYVLRTWVYTLADIAGLVGGFLSFAALAIVAAELFQ